MGYLKKKKKILSDYLGYKNKKLKRMDNKSCS